MSMFLFWTDIYKLVCNFNSCWCSVLAVCIQIVFIESIYFDTNNFILCTIFVCTDDKPSKNVLHVFIVTSFILF